MSKRYQEVNAAWPTVVPKLTGPEAVTAMKRIYRKFVGKPLRGKIEITSGNRRSRVGRYVVNPDKGWHDLVHHLSHYVHYRRYPNKQQHNPLHETVEREMVAYVVASGWLDGKLKRAQRPKVPKPSVPELRHQRVVARLAAWKTRAKRAATAIKKLTRQKRYYEKKLAAQN